MKKLISSLCLVMVLVTNLWATDVAITALPAVTSLAGTDVVPVVASGVTSKITVTNLTTVIGGGDIVAVWACVTGDCSALTGAAGDTFNASSADSSIPMVVGTGTASGITAAGQMYFESDTEILTIGDGATSINLDMAPNVTYTFPAASATLVSASDWSGSAASPPAIGSGTPAAGTFTTLTYTTLSNAGSATPGITMQDSDNAAGTAFLYGNSSGGANDIIMTLGVEDSGGESQGYIELDGVTETIDLLKPITVSQTGVKLTGSNGSLTILGLGDGQDEDIKIDLNTTANQITISSPASSADTISVSALNLVTTGQISGAIKTLSLGTTCTIGSDCDSTSTRIAYGGFILATAAITITMPAAAAGMSVCVYVRDASETVVIDVPAGDQIKPTTNATGDSISSPGAAGDFICMVAFDATDWYVLGKSGTWTDSN